MLFNPPQEMVVGHTELIVLRLTRSITDTTLATNVPGQGAPTVEHVPYLGMHMQASLRGKGFDIVPLAEKNQVVPRVGYAEWSWEVTPNENGIQRLTLLATAKIELAKDDVEYRPLPVIERETYVKVNVAYSMRMLLVASWKYIVGLAGLVIVALIISRLKFESKVEQHLGTEISVAQISGGSGIAIGPAADAEARHIDMGGGAYAEDGIGQRKGVFNSQINGSAIGPIDNRVHQALAGGGAPAPAAALLPLALDKIRAAGQAARAQGDVAFAEDLDEVAVDLEATLHAELAGNIARRSEKLGRARRDLGALMQQHPELGDIVGLVAAAA